MKKVKVGIIGCGNISDIYLKNLTTVFTLVEIKGCTDLYHERVLEKKEQYGFQKAYKDVDELLSDSEIEIVLVLTQPPYHYDICKKVLLAGKNFYVEKPLSLSRNQGMELKNLAAEKGLLAGGAPDTFLGAGIQTCRAIIEQGWIGKPIAASAFMMNHGHESWHPDPEFYYEKGGGPMFDMGPYYLTAMVNLLGPVASVSASTAMAYKERTITSEKKFGKKIKVEIPTHVAGILNFENGAIGTIVTSFDVWKHNMPYIQIYGTEGSISVPDPNGFNGPVKYQRKTADWSEVPLIYDYSENSRGLGVADMAYALRTEKSPRTGINLTYHVLDIMQSLHDSADNKALNEIKSTCEKPRLMEMSLIKGEVK